MTTERIMDLISGHCLMCPPCCMGINTLQCDKCYDKALAEAESKLLLYDELKCKLANFKSELIVKLEEL